MKKVKIIHVLTTTAGGLGQSVLSLVQHLDTTRFDVAVAFGPGYPIDRRFIDAGVRVFQVRMKRGLYWKNLLGFWDLYCLFRREKVDIVHAHNSVAGAIARLASKMAGVPIVIFTLHGYASLNHRHPAIRAVVSLIEKLLDHCTTHYVAVSEYVKRVWCEQGVVASDRVAVIYHGTNPVEINTSKVRDVVRDLKIPTGAPIIGTVGLLEVQKGTEFLLRAMPLVKQVSPDCHCLIVGSGPLRTYLENVAESLAVKESVHFLGWRDDVADLISLFDVFCLPSLNESFGLVLLEAMAQGKPIVATNAEGIPEVIINGETGLLVPPYDSEALANALIYCLLHQEVGREMGEKGRVRLLAQYTNESMVQHYERLYLHAYQQFACT